MNPMSDLTLGDLRRLNSRIARKLEGLVTWSTFSLEGFRAALESRLQGRIILIPFHWENAAFFGFTLGCTGPNGRRWLVLYECDAGSEHQLVIILHELMHIAFGHRNADISAALMREIVTFLKLLPEVEDVDLETAVAYTRLCAFDEGGNLLFVGREGEEQEAELGATWVVTQARRAGALPPSGTPFLAEHRTIDANLGGSVGSL